MLQFYFLSVSLNALVGYYLFFRNDEGSLSKTGFPLHNETVKISLGVLSALTGIIKLFSPVGGRLPVFGDLIPAIIGILCGFIMIYEFYKGKTTIDDTENTEKITSLLTANSKVFGAIALIVAAIHFLLPRVMFL